MAVMPDIALRGGGDGKGAPSLLPGTAEQAGQCRVARAIVLLACPGSWDTVGSLIFVLWPHTSLCSASGSVLPKHHNQGDGLSNSYEPPHCQLLPGLKPS